MRRHVEASSVREWEVSTTVGCRSGKRDSVDQTIDVSSISWDLLSHLATVCHVWKSPQVTPTPGTLGLRMWVTTIVPYSLFVVIHVVRRRRRVKRTTTAKSKKERKRIGNRVNAVVDERRATKTRSVERVENARYHGENFRSVMSLRALCKWLDDLRAQGRRSKE